MRRELGRRDSLRPIENNPFIRRISAIRIAKSGHWSPRQVLDGSLFKCRADASQRWLNSHSFSYRQHWAASPEVNTQNTDCRRIADRLLSFCYPILLLSVLGRRVFTNGFWVFRTSGLLNLFITFCFRS